MLRVVSPFHIVDEGLRLLNDYVGCPAALTQPTPLPEQPTMYDRSLDCAFAEHWQLSGHVPSKIRRPRTISPV